MKVKRFLIEKDRRDAGPTNLKRQSGDWRARVVCFQQSKTFESVFRVAELWQLRTLYPEATADACHDTALVSFALGGVVNLAHIVS